MRCSVFCLADKIAIAPLLAEFKLQKKDVSQIGNVICQKISCNQFLYFFEQGTVVSWNIKRPHIAPLLEVCRPYLIEPAKVTQKDDFSYQYGHPMSIKAHPYFNLDMIVLNEETPEMRLAISYALSQSTKLQHYDYLLQRMFDEHAHLIEKMSRCGRIAVSGPKLNKIMARIFLLRSRVNLESEFLSLPKYLWQHSAEEAEYLMVSDYLDIHERVTALNQKMDVLGDMFDMFNSQIGHRHTFILEVIITLLIAIEVVMTLSHL